MLSNLYFPSLYYLTFKNLLRFVAQAENQTNVNAKKTLCQKEPNYIKIPYSFASTKLPPLFAAVSLKYDKKVNI